MRLDTAAVGARPAIMTVRSAKNAEMSELRIVERVHCDPASEVRALVAGLLASPASIPPRYFYDTLGCALYGAICELPEYYPTRTERAIFVEHREAIVAAAGRGKQFVDLGAGDCRKALEWLPFMAPARYVAVDFAGGAIRSALARLAPAFPEIAMLGIVADFTHGLDLDADLGPGPVMFFFPGSSIGNFGRAAARDFLATLRRHCAQRPDSGLLIGVDTRKDSARLEAGYDDALGVTAAFNRNVLHHVNRILGSDFRPESYVHRAFYDEAHGRIEMHLEASTAQRVRLPGALRTFARGERIHTEDSYKYTPAEFAAMLADAGFARVLCWQDANRDFAVFYGA